MRKAIALLLATAVYILLAASILYLSQSIKTVTSPAIKTTQVSLVSLDREIDKADDTVNSEEVKEQKYSEDTKEDDSPKKQIKEPEEEVATEDILEKTPILKELKKVEELSRDILQKADIAPAKKVEKPEEKPKIKPVTVKKKLKKKPKKTAKKRTDRRRVKRAKSNTKKSIKRRARRGGGNPSKLSAMIKRRIERHKRYPPAAKRRKIQGRVRVSFTVTPNGGVSNITVTGKSIFKPYAKKAVRAAFPVNVRRFRVKLPHRFTVTLIYRLR